MVKMACFTTIGKSLKITLPGNKRLVRQLWGNINNYGTWMGILEPASNSNICGILSEMSPTVSAPWMLRSQLLVCLDLVGVGLLKEACADFESLKTHTDPSSLPASCLCSKMWSLSCSSSHAWHGGCGSYPSWTISQNKPSLPWAALVLVFQKAIEKRLTQYFHNKN